MAFNFPETSALQSATVRMKNMKIIYVLCIPLLNKLDEVIASSLNLHGMMGDL